MNSRAQVLTGDGEIRMREEFNSYFELTIIYLSNSDN